MGLLSLSQAPFERALEQPGWTGRVWMTQRRRTAGAQEPRSCPRARGSKVGLAASLRRPLVPAPVGASRPFFARYRCVERCRHFLNSTSELGAAKRPGAGLSLRPYFLARRPLLHRGLLRVELAATEARRCARAPHRPLHARHDPGHPLHRCRTARRPQPPPDTPLAPRPLNPSPRPFAQALARCRLTSSRLDGGAARRRSGGGLARLGRPGDPAARGRHGGGTGAHRGAPEARAAACEWGPGGVPHTGTFFPCAPHA